MKKSIIIILAALAGTLNISAQKELWITGSAVPGGTQKLETFPDGQFKFAGALNAGELKVITTDGEQASTQYLTPRSFESYVVNKGLAYTKTRSAEDAAWIVPFTEDRYKFTVDTRAQTLTGELFVPWREVYIAGGACEIGWQAFVMLPFTQDAEDPNVFTWTGELRQRNENVEPRRFKLQGQNTWNPKSLHPYTQDAPCLTSTQMRHEGDDTKWEIDRDGVYRLTVNVFRDTFKAEYLGEHAEQAPTDVDALPEGVDLEVVGHTLRLRSAEKLSVELLRTDSMRVARKSGTDVIITVQQPGVYVLKAAGKHVRFARKVAVK